MSDTKQTKGPAAENAWDLMADYQRRYPNRNWGSDGVCEICGKASDKPKLVEVGIDGFAILAGDPRSQTVDPNSPDSQGCFPIGSACARRITRRAS